MIDLTEKTLTTERKYTGKIISVDLIDIELPDGRRAKREVIRHGNAHRVRARQLLRCRHAFRRTYELDQRPLAVCIVCRDGKRAGKDMEDIIS